MDLLSPYKLLLNNLSSELDQRNLQSLIHVCGRLIPGGQRETIRTGWDIFVILSQQNVIGEEPDKMKFLLRIVKELRPKRRDLVSMIKQHIQETYEQPETILDDEELSWADGRLSPRPSTPILVDYTPCSIRCCCFNCDCHPCCDGCCCCVILAILFTFFAVVAVLLWYTHVFPQDVQDYFGKGHAVLSQLGPITIGALGFIALCCVACGFYLKFKMQRTQQAYSLFSSIAERSPIMSDRAILGSQYAASDSTRASNSVYYQRRMNASCSSGRITATSSLASTPPPQRGRRSVDLEAVPDGYSQHDVLTRNSEADHNKEDDGSTEEHLTFHG